MDGKSHEMFPSVHACLILKSSSNIGIGQPHHKQTSVMNRHMTVVADGNMSDSQSSSRAIIDESGVIQKEYDSPTLVLLEV